MFQDVFLTVCPLWSIVWNAMDAFVIFTSVSHCMSPMLQRPICGVSEAAPSQMSHIKAGGETTGPSCRMRSPILYFLVFSFSAVSWIVLLSGVSSVQYWCGRGKCLRQAQPFVRFCAQGCLLCIAFGCQVKESPRSVSRKARHALPNQLGVNAICQLDFSIFL